MRVSDQTQLAKHSVDRELSTEKPHHCRCCRVEKDIGCMGVKNDGVGGGAADAGTIY